MSLKKVKFGVSAGMWMSEGGNMTMKLKKEWNDVEKTSKELCGQFNAWRLSNLKITYGTGRTVEEIFGFPYTSSSSFAAIWNCQAEAVYKWSDEWRFEGLAVSETNNAIAIFEHEDGTVENMDRMYIIIGKVDD